MKRTYFFFVAGLLLMAGCCIAQPDSSAFHKGTITGRLTLSPTLAQQASPMRFYLHGTLGYYTDRKISLRGDGYYYLGTRGGNSSIALHHSLLSGAAFHFGNKKRLDPYAGFQAGFSLTQMASRICIAIWPPPPDCFVNPRRAVNPVWSPFAGINIYGDSLFHFFTELRYLSEKHRPLQQAAVRLSDLRLSFGLGFNF